MPSLRRVLFVLPFSLGLVLSACNTTNPSHPDNPQKVSTVGPEVVLVHDLVIPPPPATAVRDALVYLARERDRWIAAIPHPVSPPRPVTVPQSAAPATVATWPPSFQPCDGAYPPCWRVAIESGGNYNAFNPGGCGGSGCYGKWQFSGEWACKLGLPCDLATATPAQQDEAARLLWDGGAGCSNWSAC